MSAKKRKVTRRTTAVHRAPRIISLGETISEVINRWADRELRLLFGSVEFQGKKSRYPHYRAAVEKPMINVTPKK
jgi:hypothetical protein